MNGAGLIARLRFASAATRECQNWLMSTEEDGSALAPIRRSSEGLSTGAIVRLVIAGIVLIAIVVLCARNTDKTNVDYLFGDANLPLFIVVALSALAGAVLGAMESWRRHRRRRE